MKSAGKARNNGLYRHIRTSKEIIRNLLNDSKKIIGYCTGPIKRERGYYSYTNCPDKPEQGGIARCGMHEECRYCRDLLK